MRRTRRLRINDVAPDHLHERGLAGSLLADLADARYGTSPTARPGRRISTGAVSRGWKAACATHGFRREASGAAPRTLSDDAGQFDVGRHALCWVNAERPVHRLDTFTDDQHAVQQQLRALIGWFYADLRAYRTNPSARRGKLRTRFDRIFHRCAGFVTLYRLLGRLLDRKPELLQVLDRPVDPPYGATLLHTNGLENAIRCQAARRKISGGIQSTASRDCRDAFLGLAGTCAKRGVSFRNYLGHRLSVAGSNIVPALPNLSSGCAAA